MTNEERDLIAAFIARVSGVTPQQPAGGPSASPWGGASVPATAPALPPVDPEADALIAGLLQRTPGAGYRMTQLAFVQEHALAAAQARIRQLEAQVQAAQAAPQGGGFFSGLFGGGRSAPPPQMPPQAPQQMPPGPMMPPQAGYGARPGMWQQSGSGFLGSALTTAAGVAGGMMLGNALMDLLSPGRHASAASPWTDPAGASGWNPGGASAWGVTDPNIDPTLDPSLDPSNDPANWSAPDNTGADDPTAGGWDQGAGDGGWDQGGGSDDTLI